MPTRSQIIDQDTHQVVCIWLRADGAHNISFQASRWGVDSIPTQQKLNGLVGVWMTFKTVD
jgi:hypothetical protein